MAALWRLCLWGFAAAIAVSLVIAAGATEAGSQRALLAWSALKAPLDGSQPPPPAQIARSAEADETRRLVQQVRSLSADRERLVSRLDALERNLEDVTGSVARQPQPSASRAAADLPVTIPAEPAVAAANPQAQPAPSTQASQVSHAHSAPEIGWAASVAQPPAGSDTPDWPAARPANDVLTAGPATQTATAASVTPPAPTVTRTEFGVDVGGGATVSAMRGLWISIRSTHPTLLEGLRPVVTIRDNSRGSTELRLIAGPLTNAAAAARLCGALSAAGLTCQPAVFDGQRLALR